MTPFPTLPTLPNLNDVLLGGVDVAVSADYVIVLVACLLGNTFIVGFFLPAGTVAALYGFLARRGGLDVLWVIGAVWVGMIAGYNLDYFIGRFLLARIVGWSATTWLGRRLRVEYRLQQGALFLDRHGDAAIFYAYAGLGHFRSIVAVSIGMARLSYWRFLFYQLIASLLWSLIYVGLGYFIGVETTNLPDAAERLGAIAAGVFLGIYVLWALWRAATGEFYDPLIGRVSFRRNNTDGSRGPDSRRLPPDDAFEGR